MRARTGLLLTFGMLALASVSTVLVGCGGGSSKPLTEDDFCTQKAGKECNTIADTCSTPPKDCQDARKQVCLDWVAAIKAVPGTPRVFTPGNIGACLDRTAAVYKQTLIKPADLTALDDICQYVFQGDVALLDTCDVKYDCKDRGNTICDKGHCATKVVKGGGQQCPEFGAVCTATQYCTKVADATMCVDKKGTGVTCDATTPCQDTLRCVSGSCVALLKSGDKCCTDSDCPTTAPYCNPYAGFVCSTGLNFATHSPSCSVFGDTAATAAVGTPTCTSGGGNDGGTSDAGGSDGGSDAGATDAAGSDGATADHE
jgi:hypothetical protein